MDIAARLNWDDIRYFLAVARTGSLSAAAVRLAVRHTTVARRLDALEAALGGSLTLRLSSGVKLTPLGAKLLPHAEKAEREMQVLMAAAVSTRTSVRLSLPSGFARFFGEEIADFHRANPSVALELTASGLAADIKRGEADVALRMIAVSDPDLVTRRLCDVGWSLYASPRYLSRRPPPSDPRQLGSHDVIGFHPQLSQVAGAKWIEEYGQEATITLRCGQMTEMLAATASGAGLAVLPCVLADDEADVVRLSEAVLGRNTLSMVFRREVGQQAEVRAVVRFVAETIRHHRSALDGSRP